MVATDLGIHNSYHHTVKSSAHRELKRMANMRIYPLKSITGAITELLFILALLFTSSMFVYFPESDRQLKTPLWSINRQETRSGSKLAAADKLSTVTQSGFDLEKWRAAARFTALHTVSLQMI